jgi:hypothetical protein
MSIPCGDIYAPYWATYQSGAPSFQNNIIDDESEKFAIVCSAPKTGTISKVHVVCGSIGTVPGADYDIRLETVNSSGEPTGALFDTNTNGALTILSGDDDEWLPVTLTAGASVTRGDDILAVVMVPPASPDTGSVSWMKYMDGSTGFSYCIVYTGAAWIKTTQGPLVLLEYSDTTIPRIPNCFPWTRINYGSDVYSDSDPKYIGNRFKLREDTEIVGVWAVLNHDPLDSTVTLFSGTSTVERTLTFKKHHTGGTGGNDNQYAGYFSTPFNASADTIYRIAFNNNYATASGTPLDDDWIEINPSTIRTKIWDHMIYAGLFSEFYRCIASSDLSGWTETWPERMVMIGPIIRSIG